MLTDTSTSAGRAILLHDRYPTLDELTDTARHLAARHPDRCRLRTLGTSRAGRPLQLLSIAPDAPDPGAPAPDARTPDADNVLVVSGAHADEFSGRAGIVELAHRALARPTPSTPAPPRPRTWHFLLCLDPDGAHLARGGLLARTLPAYFAGYFRPAADEQPEWAPAIGGRLPESRILLDLIDELRPCLQLSLHTADVGGTFLQATADPTALAEALARSAAVLGIPIETGSFDTHRLPVAGPGVFLMEPHHIDTQENTTGMLAPGQQAPAGARAATWFAPRRHGGRTVVVEVPAWTSDRLGDPAPAGDDAHRHLRAGADRLRERGRQLVDLTAALPPHDTPVLRAVRTQLTALHQLAEAWDPATADRPHPPPPLPTRAHLAGVDLWSHRIPVRAAALLCRATPVPGPGPTELLHTWCAQYRRRFRPTWLPVARQAAHHANIAEAAAVAEAAGVVDRPR
ncbi:M14 family zinc carboxypeptidase [Kitasatospora sp. NPDC094011]|uniref:M14 family zinc carboxypeptidase n=1 Tax=Kitasatospora sp. NPDC094011 TaxID=3364090 RepID=UPI0038162FFB